MTRPSSCSCRRRSDSRLAVAAAVLVATLVVPAVAAAGTVEGTVSVERASVRTDGPKHDRDVVITLEPVAGAAPAPEAGTATMDQQGLVFVPHVLAIPRGTKVTFLNSDGELDGFDINVAQEVAERLGVEVRASQASTIERPEMLI